jgi:hypothetical protein
VQCSEYTRCRQCRYVKTRDEVDLDNCSISSFERDNATQQPPTPTQSGGLRIGNKRSNSFPCALQSPLNSQFAHVTDLAHENVPPISRVPGLSRIYCAAPWLPRQRTRPAASVERTDVRARGPTHPCAAAAAAQLAGDIKQKTADVERRS